ncbi:MAG: aminotransferase, class [Bryobacterales bacterium]|nr:aminotransferase, class [Bryobacterales bacterium]
MVVLEDRLATQKQFERDIGHPAEGSCIETCHDIAKMVSRQHFAFPLGLRNLHWLHIRQTLRNAQERPESIRRNPGTQMSCHRRKHVPTVECPAHWVTEILRGSDLPNGRRAGLRKNACEQPVIGRDPEMPGGFGENRLALTAYPRVHHRQMHRAGREAAPNLIQHPGGLPDLVRRDLVGDIDQMRFRADAQDDALHGANIVIRLTEIGEQRNDGAFHFGSQLNWKLALHCYFDHNATTPVAPEVLRGLQDIMAEVYGNASSIHYYGQAAKRHLEGARRSIAARLQCDPREIVFTSGGTEADNLAIFGTARRFAAGSHVITSCVEHPAVLNACAQLEREGYVVTRVPVDGSGLVDPADIRRALRPDTVLITFMHANNETGVVQPIGEIAAIAKEARVVFHSDGVQTAGRLALHLNDGGPDLFAISGHKFGAPKGVGALYVRKGVSLQAQLYGGHHERDRRAGTENVPGAAARGMAAATSSDWASVAPLRDKLERAILDRIRAATVNGGGAERLPNTTNIRFDGIEGEAMVIALDLRGYAVSSGSACSSGAVEPSHVLLAMGLSPAAARSSVRFSLGPSNTAEEVDGLIDAVTSAVTHLRRISPEVLHG